MSREEFIQTVLQQYADAVRAALRQLLETKHLYQSLLVPVPMQIDPKGSPEAQGLAQHIQGLETGPWYLFGPTHARGRAAHTDVWGTGEFANLAFAPPDVKLFCEAPCDREEPFNLVSVDDILAKESGGVSGSVQVFALGYRCQSCKGTPTVLLVRRDEKRMTLCGRTPIEHVAVPPVIPKAVKHFYSGAIVAHQSGQTLAGNFLLRTLIEQWARTATNSSGLADEVLDAYVGTLPEDFRQRFPVLRETYKRLSADLHAATGTETAFDQARGEIVKHFDARRLFDA